MKNKMFVILKYSQAREGSKILLFPIMDEMWRFKLIGKRKLINKLSKYNGSKYLLVVVSIDELFL